MLTRLRNLLNAVIGRSRTEAEIAEELAFHLRSRIDDLVAHALSAEEATRQARLEFGGIEVQKERCREALGWRLVDEVRADLAYGAHGLLQHRAFALVAILTLALGIGANTVMFGVLDALLLRPPSGVANPGTVVRLFPIFEHPTGLSRTQVSTSEYEALRRDPLPGTTIAAYEENTAKFGSDPESPAIAMTFVSKAYFALLGVTPERGRFFSADEQTSEAAGHVAVLSDAFWKTTYAGRANAIGATVVVNGLRLRVVGVVPSAFTGTDLNPPAIWVPLPLAENEALLGRYMANPHTIGEYRWLRLLARLQPGIQRPRMLSLIETRLRRADGAMPASRRSPYRLKRVALAALNAHFGPEQGEAPVSIWFLAVTGIVLLIACANLANLLLARAVHRRREIGVRLALGASRSRIIRQLLVENLLLAALAGVAALALTVFCTRLINLLPLPPLGSLVDWRVLAFTAAVSILATIGFGIVPAFWATQDREHILLKNAGPTTTGGGSRLRSGLLIAQLSLSLVLLVAAGLFVRSLKQVERDGPGFDTRSVVFARLDLQDHGYSAADAEAFEDALLSRLQQSPGIFAPALTTSVAFRDWGLVIVGIAPAAGRLGPPKPAVITSDAVSPEFFRTLQLPLVNGRTFGAADRAGAPDVAVINTTMAHAFWPAGDAIGQCVHFGFTSPECTTIIGVVGADVRYKSATEAERPELYRPIAQMPAAAVAAGLAVRVDGSMNEAISAVRTAISSLNPKLANVPIRPFENWMEPTITPWRVASLLTGAFGLLAFGLAAIGLVGLMLFVVAQRTRELGVRLALGATPSEVVRLIVRDGLRLTGLGILLGLGTALATSRLLTSRLYEVSPVDPTTYLGAAAILLGVAIVATYLPARRASLVDPSVVLRAE